MQLPQRHDSPGLPEVTHLLGSALVEEVNIASHEPAAPRGGPGAAWGGRGGALGGTPPASLDAGGVWGGGGSSWASRVMPEAPIGAARSLY